jgi:hypothetical protein
MAKGFFIYLCRYPTLQWPLKKRGKNTYLTSCFFLMEKVLLIESPSNIMISKKFKLMYRDFMVNDWLLKKKDIITLKALYLK